MERYEIRGLYPDRCRFQAFVECEDLENAIILAQGVRKVTTVKVVALYDVEGGDCLYYDHL